MGRPENYQLVGPALSYVQGGGATYQEVLAELRAVCVTGW